MCECGVALVAHIELHDIMLWPFVIKTYPLNSVKLCDIYIHDPGLCVGAGGIDKPRHLLGTLFMVIV